MKYRILAAVDVKEHLDLITDKKVLRCSLPVTYIKGATTGGAKGLKFLLSQVIVKTKYKIMDNFDLVCILVI